MPYSYPELTQKEKSWWPEFHSQLFDLSQRAVEWEEISHDVVSWVESNRYILGESWRYDSTGPKIEYGDFDIVHERLPRPYLLEFVRDQTPVKSIIKARQVEQTENQINECLFYCLTRPHTRVSHIFPTLELGYSISNEKIAPAIDESPPIKKHLVGGGAVKRYPFDNGSMYTIGGALQKAGGRAASRDILVFDEVDSMPESIFGVYEELLSHSPMKYIRKLSTPTVPDVGIDKIVKDGCEFEWVIKCPKCKKEQTFHFPDSFINYFELSEYDIEDPKYVKRLNKVYIGCRFCKEYIDRGSEHYLTTSRWVPKKPTRVGIHNSYQMPIMMVPWKTGREITRRVHELADYVAQYQNEVLGFAHIGDEQRLTESDLMACVRPWKMISSRISAMSNISVGIDFGKEQSWIIVVASGIEAAQPHKKSVVYIEEINKKNLQKHGFNGDPTDHVKRVRQVCDLFGADIVVADAGGLGLDRVVYLTKWFPKRAWGCLFDTAEEGRQIRQSRLLQPMWTENQKRVTVSKVNEWKNIIGECRRQGFFIPSIHGTSGEMVKAFIKHMQGLGIQPRWNVEYEREFEVCVRMSNIDHLACCMIYATIGWNKLTGNKYIRTPGVVLKKTVPGTNIPVRPIGV